jgi:HAD superfamily hydrolase (TIGR01509 family)
MIDRYGLHGDTVLLLERYQRTVMNAYRSVDLMPGARELFAGLPASVSIGVVTSNSEALTREWLHARGVGSRVQAVIGRESVVRGKPDPQPYLVALTSIGCSAGDCIAIEDSAAGAAAAMRAGIPTYLLATASVSPGAEGLRGTLTRLDEILPLFRA